MQYQGGDGTGCVLYDIYLSVDHLKEKIGRRLRKEGEAGLLAELGIAYAVDSAPAPTIMAAPGDPCMSATKPIDAEIIEESIVTALRNVCERMIRSEVVLKRKRVDPKEEAAFQMMSNVGFVGSINGNVILALSEDFAIYATGRILGMSPGEIEMHGPDVVKDAIGEITNMTAGGFKNRLCDLGYPCKLSLPYIVRGTKLQVSTPRDSNRNIFEFECAGHILLADVQFKPE